ACFVRETVLNFETILLFMSYFNSKKIRQKLNSKFKELPYLIGFLKYIKRNCNSIIHLDYNATTCYQFNINNWKIYVQDFINPKHNDLIEDVINIFNFLNENSEDIVFIKEES